MQRPYLSLQDTYIQYIDLPTYEHEVELPSVSKSDHGFELQSQNPTIRITKDNRQTGKIQEWSVQRSQHQSLINDLTSTHNHPMKATQNWIKQFRQNDVCTGTRYKDERIKKKLHPYLRKWKKILTCASFPLIEPTSLWLLVWDILIAICILLIMFVTIISGYYVYIISGKTGAEDVDLDQKYLQQKHREAQQGYWDSFIDKPLVYASIVVIALFTFDVFMQFHVPVLERGIYVYNRWAIAKHYVSFGFWFDIIPLSILLLTVTVPEIRSLEAVHYLIFLKFYQLYWIDKRIKDRIQLQRKYSLIDIIRTKASYLIFKIIVQLLLATQLFATIFFRVGVYAYNEIEIAADNKKHTEWKTWINNPNGNFPDIYSRSRQDQIILSLYWSFATMTTIAYGDITPMNPYEIVVSEVGMIMAIFFFALNVQSVFDIIEEYRELARRYKKYRVIMNRFMRDKAISFQLQNKIRKYLDHVWYQQKARENEIEDMIIDQLAPQLKEELMYESYGPFLIQIPWFKENFSFDFVKELSQDVEEMHFANRQPIYSREDDHALYYIKSGQVELFVENEREDVALAQLKQKMCFGQLAFITGQARTCQARSRAFTEIYRVPRAKFLERLSNFPQDYEKFRQLHDEISLNQKNQLLNIRCFTCNSVDHTAVECPLTHLSPIQNHQHDLTWKNDESDVLQKRKIRQRRQNRKKRRIILPEERIQNAKDCSIEKQYDCPEIMKLIDLQKQASLMIQPTDWVSFDLDQVKIYQHYFPHHNIDALFQTNAKRYSSRSLNAETPLKKEKHHRIKEKVKREPFEKQTTFGIRGLYTQ